MNTCQFTNPYSSKMSKILFCNNLLSGMLLFRRDIIQHFKEQGKAIVLVVIKSEADEKYLEELIGIKVYTIDVSRTSTNPLNDLRFFSSFWKILGKEKPDYVFNYTIKPNIYGAIACRLRGIPCTDMMAGLGYTFTNNNLSSKIARTLYRIGLACAQHLFLLNEENVQAVKKLKLCNDKKIIWLKGGEGVNLNHYQYFNNETQSITFLFIARLIEEKGYRQFVKAAKIIREKYPDVQFHVVGEYDFTYPKAISKEEVEKDVEDGYIKYMGVTTNMLDFYSRPGYIICIPSYYSEGLNRSLMEGCAVGKPIITTEHWGCKEMVIDGKNGYIVPKQDVAALANAMEKYILQPTAEKNAMSLNSRKWAEKHFDVKIVIAEYEKILLSAKRKNLT
nr:glycosyltransferase family 4 protein [Hoylesella saccharolytica]